MRLLGPLFCFLLVLAGCGDNYATVEPENPPRAADGLVFTRADGSSYTMKDAVAKCVEHRQLPGVKVVRLTAPADRQQASDVSDGREPALVIEVALGVQGTRKLPLQERDHDAGPSDVVLFGEDPERHNELSGTVGEASGKMTVFEATCDPEPRLSLRLDATLGSKVGPKVKVRGGLASMLPG
jgi:hypothetical protein